MHFFGAFFLCIHQPTDMGQYDSWKEAIKLVLADNLGLVEAMMDSKASFFSVELFLLFGR